MFDAQTIFVRQAREDERDQVLDVLTEAADWLISEGIHQWPSPFPAKYMEDDLRNGRTYLALADDALAGTLTLKDHDPTFWPGAAADALYVHRVAIRRRHRGLGAFLLHWAEQRARAKGKDYLRLDCWYEDMPLRSYYEKRGFTYKGLLQLEVSGPQDYGHEITADGPWNCALYEKKIDP